MHCRAAAGVLESPAAARRHIHDNERRASAIQHP
jgi:hypothetical protein